MRAPATSPPSPPSHSPSAPPPSHPPSPPSERSSHPFSLPSSATPTYFEDNTSPQLYAPAPSRTFQSTHDQSSPSYYPGPDQLGPHSTFAHAPDLPRPQSPHHQTPDQPRPQSPYAEAPILQPHHGMTYEYQPGAPVKQHAYQQPSNPYPPPPHPPSYPASAPPEQSHQPPFQPARLDSSHASYGRAPPAAGQPYAGASGVPAGSSYEPQPAPSGPAAGSYAPQPPPPASAMPAPVAAGKKEEAGGSGLYFAFGLVLALFLNFFAFAFLCCADCLGIQGRRRPMFVGGAAVGVVVNFGIYLVLYAFVWRQVKEALDTVTNS